MADKAQTYQHLRTVANHLASGAAMQALREVVTTHAALLRKAAVEPPRYYEAIQYLRRMAETTSFKPSYPVVYVTEEHFAYHFIAAHVLIQDAMTNAPAAIREHLTRTLGSLAHEITDSERQTLMTIRLAAVAIASPTLAEKIDRGRPVVTSFTRDPLTDLFCLQATDQVEA